MENKNLQAFVELGLFSPAGARRIDWLFRCMRLAEEEIAAAKTNHPKKLHVLIDGAFKHAHPTDLIRVRQSDSLYQAHVRELIERMINGVDVRLGTKAEVLSMMIEGSMIAPLTCEFYALYVRCFSALYPQHLKAVGNPDWKKEEPWPGRTDELLAELQRKTANHRGVKPKPKPGGKPCAIPESTTSPSMTPVESILAKFAKAAANKPSRRTAKKSLPTHAMRPTSRSRRTNRL